MLSIQSLLFVIKLIDKGILTTEEASVMAHDYCGTLFGMSILINQAKGNEKKNNRKPLSSDFQNKGTKQ